MEDYRNILQLPHSGLTKPNDRSVYLAKYTTTSVHITTLINM